MLHCIYISDDVLPLEYHDTVLCMLHDDYGHQGLDQTLALVRERFYWNMMNHDATEYVTNCHQCHVVKSHYTGPHMQQGLLVANNPLDLLCIDFLKLTHQGMVKRTSWYRLMPSPSSVRPSSLTTRRHLLSPRYWLKNGSMCMASQPVLTATRAEVLKMP